MSEECLFCRIVAGELPARKLFEDEHVFAFADIRPVAPVHVLVLPKRHLPGLDAARPEDAALLGRLQLAAAGLARQLGLEPGYRTVVNNGPAAGQTVAHLHLHLLGGRPLGWPPG